jgi:hypothetical protein
MRRFLLLGYVLSQPSFGAPPAKEALAKATRVLGNPSPEGVGEVGQIPIVCG